MVRPRSLWLLVLLPLVVTALPGTMSAALAPAPPLSPALASEPHPRPAAAPTASEEAAAARTPAREAATPPASIEAQIVSFYGYPGFPVMGALGAYSPELAADAVSDVAAQYDALNGDRDTLAALHLIVAVAQRSPQADESYLLRSEAAMIAPYVEVARERGLLLFLDVQIGWADPLEEVQHLEQFLLEPFVHLALDPEFATAASGVAPGLVIGTLEADDVNAVQRYLARLVREQRLPPKLLVVHQFMEGMLAGTDRYEARPEVELVVDMDGFGSAAAKLSKYELFSLGAYAERPALKLFYDWDTPLLTPEQVLALEVPPDLVIYQ